METTEPQPPKTGETKPIELIPVVKPLCLPKILIAGSIVLALMSLGAAVYLAKNRTTPSVCTQEVKQCPDGSYVRRTGANCAFDSCPTPSPTVFPTANWKIYTNNDLRFSFKYPFDWQVESSQAAKKQGQIAYTAARLAPQDYKTDLGHPIVLGYIENPENLSIEKFSQKLEENNMSGDPIGLWSPNDQQISNLNGIKAYYQKEHYCVANCQQYVWLHNSKIFRLVNFPINTVANQKEIFDQIFFTFNFLDQYDKDSGDISKWKTYRGETSYTDDGSSVFTIKYPPAWVLVGRTLYPRGNSDIKTDPYIILGSFGIGGPQAQEERNFPAGDAFYYWNPRGKTIDGKTYFVSAYATLQINNISYIFQVSNIPEENSAKYEEIFNKMLSTFKPLNP